MLSILYSELRRFQLAILCRMQRHAWPRMWNNHASPCCRKLISQGLVLTSIAVTMFYSSEHLSRWARAADNRVEQPVGHEAVTTAPSERVSISESVRTNSAFEDNDQLTKNRIADDISQFTSPLSSTIDDDACEIWEISTRHLPDRFRCINTSDPGFDVHRFACGRWLPDSLDRALTNDGKLTIVYVHGNFMERNNTLQRVRIVDGYLKPRTTRPYRLILFSWPSQREPHPLRDVLENAESAECQSLYLAWLLERLGDQSQVSLLGFSFGGRTVTGALHLTSGGSIHGLNHQSVAGPDGIRSSYHVGLVAPAVDRNWLAINGKHNHALDRVEAFHNLYNSHDPVLRRFQWLDRTNRPVAGGFAGFVGLSQYPASQHRSDTLDSHSVSQPIGVSFGQATQRQQFNCSNSVGSTHSERSYYKDCPTFPLILDSLLWNEPIGSCLSP